MEETVSAQALRDSEELHRITLLSMSDAVFITDDAGAFTYICPNVDVIFGHRQDEVRAMGRISRLLGRELIEPAQLTVEGEIRNIEHEIETRDGARRVVLVHVKQVAIKGGTMLYVCRDITDRKQSEQALRRNEERLTLALEAAGAGTWDWHVPTGEMSWSPETHRLLGDTASARPPSFDSFLQRVHPLDRARVARTMTEAMDHGASYETEFRVIGYDGLERWVVGKGKAVRNGKPLRMLGVFVDFTERHEAARQLSELGGRLIKAHEDERSRLARELHDDISQRLALLATDISLLRQGLTNTPEPVLKDWARLSAAVEDIASALHRMSHEFHPARLGLLGLAESIRLFCRDLTRGQELTVRLEIPDPLPALDGDVALGLYRITQEALRNVVRHSRAANVTVSLAATGGNIYLGIVDDGTGFETGTVRQQDSLGMISMRERARLVGGHLSLTSTPGAGTRLEVVVPMGAAASTVDAN